VPSAFAIAGNVIFSLIPQPFDGQVAAMSSDFADEVKTCCLQKGDVLFFFV
jgi:hypothetical protein